MLHLGVRGRDLLPDDVKPGEGGDVLEEGAGGHPVEVLPEAGDPLTSHAAHEVDLQHQRHQRDGVPGQLLKLEGLLRGIVGAHHLVSLQRLDTLCHRGEEGERPRARVALLVVVLQPVGGSPFELVSLLPGLEPVDLRKDDDDGDSLDGGGLDVGEPAYQPGPLPLRVADDQVRGRAAAEAGVDAAVLGVAREVPEIHGAPFLTEREQLRTSVLPFHYLQASVHVCVHIIICKSSKMEEEY